MWKRDRCLRKILPVVRDGYRIASMQSPSATAEEEEGPDVGVYAGLGRRFIAFIVDIILILLIGIDRRSRSLTSANGLKFAYLHRCPAMPR